MRTAPPHFTVIRLSFFTNVEGHVFTAPRPSARQHEHPPKHAPSDMNNILGSVLHRESRWE